jgi:aspartate kinase
MFVLKFGGATLRHAADLVRAATIVAARRNERPVVVVSALAGVTDRLLALETEPDPVTALEALADDHRRIAGESGPDDLSRLDTEAAQLARWLATRNGREWTSADRDRIAAHGELWSARLLVGALRRAELPADWVDARHFLLTDDRFGAAVPDRPAITRGARRFLAPLLAGGRIPVTQGFIGATADGQTTTLGRGGSDLTAALVGAALQAERVELWGDTDGIFTADRDLVSNARVVPELSYDQAFDLAGFCPRSARRATWLPLAQAGIPCWIRNVEAARRPGTRIGPEMDRSAPRVDAIGWTSRASIVTVEGRPGVDSAELLRSVAAVLARHEVGTGGVTCAGRRVSLVLDHLERPGLRLELERIGTVTRTDDRALVWLVGRDLPGLVGLNRRLLNAVRPANMEVVAHGASETRMMLITSEREAPAVVRRLHDELFGGMTRSRRPARRAERAASLST